LGLRERGGREDLGGSSSLYKKAVKFHDTYERGGGVNLRTCLNEAKIVR